MPNNMPSQPEFPIVRRGFDPDSVDRHLAALRRELEDRLAAAEARHSNLEAALAEAHQREEAVHLTLVAATKTKEEMLVGARQEAERLTSRSREQAEALLGEAKNEAFRLVTDARETAQETTAVARASAEEVRAAAQAAAESIRDKARLEAIEMIDSVETDTTSLLAAREAALTEMRARYQDEEAELIARIDVLRTAANDLETRLKAIAAGTLGAATSLVSDLPARRAAEASATPAVSEMPVVSEPRPMPKARPPIRQELTEARLSTTQPEHATMTASSTSEVTTSVSEPIATPNDEIAAREIAAAEEAAAAELAAAARATEMTEARLRAAAIEMPAEPLNLNGHTYVERIDDIEDLQDKETVEERVTTREDDYDTAAADEVAADFEEPTSDEPGVIVEPAASEEPEAEEESERVPVAVGATPPRVPFEDEGGRKGSYYSRRSAKLPRIGNEAGRNALAAANAIRGASRGMPVDDD